LNQSHYFIYRPRNSLLLKKLKGRHFSSDAEVIVAADTWLDGQTSEFFFEWLAKVWSLLLVTFLVRLRTYQHPDYRVVSGEIHAHGIGGWVDPRVLLDVSTTAKSPAPVPSSIRRCFVTTVQKLY